MERADGRVKRRELIFAGLPAIAVSVGTAGNAQTALARVGVLMGFEAGNSEGVARLRAFTEGLAQLGWKEGQNIELVQRWSPTTAGRLPADAEAIVRSRPAVILADRSPATAALLQATKQIPIVFVQVTDPVGQKFVESLARPMRNVTGFTDFEPAMAGKWLELLKEMAPRTGRVALAYNPQTAAFASALIPVFEAAARARGVEALPTAVKGIDELGELIARLGATPGGGLVMPPDAFFASHRDAIVQALLHHRVPAINVSKHFVLAGALMSYGNDTVDQYRRAAAYADRVLKGAAPGQLAVQAPVKFELAINVRTAKALELTVPSSLLFRVDELIE